MADERPGMQRTAVPEEYDADKVRQIAEEKQRAQDRQLRTFGGTGQHMQQTGQLEADKQEFDDNSDRILAYANAQRQRPGGEAVGELATRNWDAANWASGQNAANPTKTNAEELADRRANFYYGGSADTRAQTVADIQAGRQKYGGTFDALGADASAQAQAARDRRAFTDDYNSSMQRNAASNMFDQAQKTAGVGRQFQDFATQGPGPSAAQAQLAENTSAAMQNQLAMARSGRGMGESASAMRSAAGNVAGLQMTAGNQAAMLRAQEESDWRGKQLAAMGGAANAYGAAGGAYGAAGGLSLQGAQYYTDTNMKNRALNDQTSLAYADQARQVAQGGAATDLGYRAEERAVNLADLGANESFEANVQQYYGINKGVEANEKAADKAAAQQRESGLIAAGSGFLAAAADSGDNKSSDIREKKNIRPLNGSMAFNPRYGGSELTPVFDDPYPEDTPAAPVNVGGQSVEKRDVDFSGLDEAQASQAVREAPGFSFEYKDPAKFGYEDKTYVGPMAQDLAKTPAGRSTVTKMPGGELGVDTSRLSLVNTAALNSQQAELDALKKEIENLGKGPSAVSQAYAEKKKTSDIREKKNVKAADVEFDMRTPSESQVAPPVAIQRPPAEYRREDIGKSREQLEREASMQAAFDMRRAAAPTDPVTGLPLAIARPRPAYGPGDVGKSSEQIESQSPDKRLASASGELERLKAEIASLKKQQKGGS